MKNRLYQGVLYHRRNEPKQHTFSYQVFLPYLNLGELKQTLRGLPLWGTSPASLARFKRSDFLPSSEESLEDAARNLVEQELGFRPQGSVFLLANLRYFGYVINPITCYFCFHNDRLAAVVLEVTNTPWDERVTYVLPAHEGRVEHIFSKQMHVSPFNPMDLDYHWSCNTPDETLQIRLDVGRGTKTIFNASLSLRAQPLTKTAAVSALIKYPLMTAKVACGIYWQALRLWFKKTPIHPHPKAEQII